jgi:integrase
MTRQYNHRFKLTPMPATQRWRKIYKGKFYYVGVGHCSGKYDREGYKIAWAEWQALKDKMDNIPTAEEQQLYDLVQDAEAWANEPLDPEYVRQRRAQDEEIERVVAKMEGRRRAEENTVGCHVQEFLATKRQRHTLGVLSANRVRTLEQHLRTVEECLGKDTPIKMIDEGTVKIYWQSLVDRVKAGDIGRTTAADRWATFREWVRSLYSIPQPRNLNSRDLSLSKPSKTVMAWTVDEVNSLLAKSPPRFELWALLMLNCGMYAGDISNLTPTEVDWDQGRIIRRRSKTQHLDNTPTINYPLWARTFMLLKKYGRRTGERVFVNRKAQPLVQQYFKANGKMKNQDSIYDAYRRGFPKPRKPLKALRKTGATLLDTHDTYVLCIEHYLAHTPRTVTDRSYRNYSQERFDAAIRWLGQQLGIQ